MLGGYYWVAVLADGERLEQVKPDGQERSVDELRGKAVVELHLVPLDRSTHVPIVLRVREGEDFIKFWRRFMQAPAEGGQTVDVACVDVVGVKPTGRSRRPVFLFVMPDGSILMTTDKEAV